jgi:hypothetical protein
MANTRLPSLPKAVTRNHVSEGSPPAQRRAYNVTRRRGQYSRGAVQNDRAMRGVTPALSACRRPLHRRLAESGKPTASPRRSPETQLASRKIINLARAREPRHRCCSATAYRGQGTGDTGRSSLKENPGGDKSAIHGLVTYRWCVIAAASPDDRHARACRGHPRLQSLAGPKTWMAGHKRVHARLRRASARP